MKRNTVRKATIPVAGLGHAVHCAKSFIGDETFTILLGDDIVDER